MNGRRREQLRRKLQSRRDDSAHDDRGSIILALFIILTSSILVLTVAGTAISQQVLAQRTVERNDALAAAEAGLDAALGEIRAATSTSDVGQPEELPCDWPTPGDGFTLTGYLDSNTSAKYVDTVTYYGDVEPTTANISNGTATAVEIDCYTGLASPTYPDEVPYYATIIATGQDQNEGVVTAPTREIEEIYAFTDDNVDNPGGVIEDFDADTDYLCLSASPNETDVTPVAGGSIYVDTCLTAGDEDQTWEYLQNFEIELGSTATSANPLCIANVADANPVELEDCSTTSPPDYQQQWGIDDSGQYQPVAPTPVGAGGAASGGVCLNEETNSTGSQVNLATCSGGFSATQTWQPTPSVGAGDAGAATQQFVNYEEFGNCMDVTNQSVTASYLIDYMCKQFPDGAHWSAGLGTNPYDPTWNQRWAPLDVTWTGAPASPPAAQPEELETHILPGTTGNTVYCLWSPDNITDGTAGAGGNPSWVTVQVCPTLGSGNTLALAGSTDGYSNEGFVWYVNTSTTYMSVDYWGNCLNADTADQQQPGGGSYFSTLTVAACNSALPTEEWNAPPTLSPAAVSHVFEPDLSGT